MGSHTLGSPSLVGHRSEKRVECDGRRASTLVDGTEWQTV